MHWSSTFNVFKFDENGQPLVVYHIEVQHLMYLNPVVPFVVLSKNTIEVQHLMYLNFACSAKDGADLILKFNI